MADDLLKLYCQKHPRLGQLDRASDSYRGRRSSNLSVGVYFLLHFFAAIPTSDQTFQHRFNYAFQFVRVRARLGPQRESESSS